MRLLCGRLLPGSVMCVHHEDAEEAVFLPSAGLRLADLSLLGLSVLAAAVSAGFFSALSAAGLSPPSSTLCRCADLKSVSYQPLPLRRNPAADTSLRKAGLPQFGHCVSAGSLIFCSASRWWPQARHWYSYIGMANPLKAPGDCPMYGACAPGLKPFFAGGK